MIYQGEAFNGKPTKTARSHGKKFQVSVKQETSRLLVGNFHFYLYKIIGWLMVLVKYVMHVCNLRHVRFVNVTGEFGVGLHAEIQFHDGRGGL